MDAVNQAAHLIGRAAELTADRNGIACAKLVVFANAPEDNPFMAGAFHGVGEAETVINIGISGPGVVRATIERWPSVTRGEHRHIFPFQESADVMFNSTLVYELAVLKPLAEELLREITPGEPQYSEARRMLRFLQHFVAVEDWSAIPCNSLLQEFIGGSCFE